LFSTDVTEQSTQVGKQADVIHGNKWLNHVAVLKAEKVLDGFGYYMAYGEYVNTHAAALEGILPLIFAERFPLSNEKRKNAAIDGHDVEQPEDTLLWRLYQGKKGVLCAASCLTFNSSME
jgi:predicted homoserine dehydrogenase-like protein